MAFAPGQSGNPKGRTPGAKNRARGLRSGLFANVDLPKIIQKMAEKAQAGDTAAATWIGDRCLPKLRTVAPMASLELQGTYVQQGERILAAVATGQLSPDTGTDMLALLTSVARLSETTELLRRLEILEARLLEKKS